MERGLRFASGEHKYDKYDDEEHSGRQPRIPSELIRKALAPLAGYMPDQRTAYTKDLMRMVKSVGAQYVHTQKYARADIQHTHVKQGK